MRWILVVVCFMLLPSLAYPATSVTKNNITWTFNADYTVGQFANGDYYVVCPSGCQVTEISPAPTTDGGYAKNGSMLNIDISGDSTGQGFDGQGTFYSAGLNAALSLPISLVSGDKLVSAESQLPPDGGSNDSFIETMEILTVVSSAPASGSFRPGYCDSGLSYKNVSSIDYTTLGKLTPTASAPTMAAATALVDGFWPDFQYNYLDYRTWPNSYMGLPGASQNGQYGQYITEQIDVASLALQLDYSDAQKEALAIQIIQRGIDMYSVVANGGERSFYHNGGWNAGRKALILLSGIMLNDTNMKAIGAKSGDYALEGTFGSPPADYIYFQEDAQIMYVTEAVIATNMCGDYSLATCPNDPDEDYTSAHLGMPEWGIRWTDEEWTGGAVWTGKYRVTNTAVSWHGFVLAAHIMGAKTLWNHDSLFDFIDRYWAISHGLDDGWNVPDEVSGSATSGFPAEMWTAYRANYTYSGGSTGSAAMNGSGTLPLSGAGSMTLQ